MTRVARRVRPDAAAAAFLFVLYCVTLARGVTYWDAGEFLAAVHSLGIPHPPGTPLFVLLARVWSDVTGPVLGFTIAVNAFSALCTAAAFGIVANLFWRWTSDPVAAFCAAITGGLMSTVWLNATETEVYASSLFAALLLLWTANRAAETGESRWMLLTAYVCGLGWSLHLTALLTIPVALWALAARRRRPSLRVAAGAILLVIAGMSVVLFMLVRARHDPAVNQANPASWTALWDALERRQYDVAPLWPRRAPLWLQFGNVFEYADWQFALGLAPDPPPSWGRTSLTVAYAALGVVGSLWHRRVHRASWRMWLVLLVTTSIGVVLYLNLRAGASYGYSVLPPGSLHEARDRDYFFTWAFVAWGAWAGCGAAAIVGAARASRPVPVARLRWAAAMAVIVAALPLVFNWSAIRMQRVQEQKLAEHEAASTLSSAPPRAVLFAVGDNDTYPLWYMQQVRGVRRDVVVVTLPLLPAEWYRAELRRRFDLLDSVSVDRWRGPDSTAAEVTARAGRQLRPVIHTPLLQSAGD